MKENVQIICQLVGINVSAVMWYIFQQNVNLFIVIGVAERFGRMTKSNLNIYSNKKWNKYKNQKVVIDNIRFDSKKEGNYYTKLKILRNAGKISDLELQKKFVLQPSFKLNGKTYRAITYVADFVYKDDKGMHVVDTKGYRTEVYKIKKKLFMKKFGIEIEEI